MKPGSIFGNFLWKKNIIFASGFVADIRSLSTAKASKFYNDNNYRNTIYDNSFSGLKSAIGIKEIKDLTKLLLKYIDHSIESNKRKDKLYHAYNLLTIEKDKLSISYLPEMLEGQVAVLSSGYLNSKQNLEVLDALKASKLFRDDQYSYILYPDKDLGLFLDKNNIPNSKINESNLLKELLKLSLIHI